MLLARLLRVNDLSVEYITSGRDSVCAVSHADLVMDRGEVVGIVGKSGSGKSTLALALLQALPRNARMHGTIEFLGDTIAPIFQEPMGALHPMLTVRKQVCEAAMARGRSHAEADQALRSVGLPDDFRDAWPHHLSGGQRQRVLIAQAMVGRPSLIVADEPVASLDAESKGDVLEVMRSIQRELSAALIFITHSPTLLNGFTHRILRMDNGRLLQDPGFTPDKE
jgi:peptide/nickel transport system ATP-binding protein